MKKVDIIRYRVLIVLLLIVTTQVFTQNCSAEFQKFLNGERSVFLSEGLTKANGLKLRMEYPKSWSNRDGKRPQVLQFFKSPELFEMASISMIQISKIYDGTQEELEYYSDEIADELLSDSVMRTIIKINDESIIEDYKFTNTRISNLSAVYSSFITTNQGNAGIGEIRMYSQIYLVIYNDYFIIVNYMIQQHINETEIQFNKRINEYKPLLTLMANSIIILNQYDY